jgi:protein-tyrosine phosphatase
MTLAELMASRAAQGGVQLQYKRVPITAERPPDFADISDLMDVVIRNHATETPIVVNCQLGRGRSTVISV